MCLNGSSWSRLSGPASEAVSSAGTCISHLVDILDLWTVTLLLSCKPLGQTGCLSNTWSALETFLSTCTLEEMHGAETRGRSLMERILINTACTQNKVLPLPLVVQTHRAREQLWHTVL